MNGSVRKPNFLGIGATKAGTSSLPHYLKQRPEISSPTTQEPGYFCRGGDDSSIFYPIRTPEAYFGMFRGVRDEKAWGRSPRTTSIRPTPRRTSGTRYRRPG